MNAKNDYIYVYLVCNSKQPDIVNKAVRMPRQIDVHAHADTRAHTRTRAHTQLTRAQEMVVAATKGGESMKRVWCGGCRPVKHFYSNRRRKTKNREMNSCEVWVVLLHTGGKHEHEITRGRA